MRPGCEHARPQPTFAWEGGEEMSLMSPSASSPDPLPRLRDVLGLVSGLLAEYEHRVANLLLKDLASSSVGDSELPELLSALKDQIAQVLDAHPTAVSKAASRLIERRIEECGNVGSSSSSSTQPASVAREPASSPSTFPQGGNETAHTMDGNAEPNLKLRDVFGLVSGLLDDFEAHVALLLVDTFAFSKLGWAELGCTQAAFKDQINCFLDTHSTAVSDAAFVFIQLCIDEDAVIEAQAAGGDMASVFVQGTSDTIVEVGQSVFNSFSPRASPSWSRPHTSFNSLPHGFDRIAILPDEGDAHVHFAPNRALFRHADDDASDSEQTDLAESIGSDEYVSGGETIAPNSSSSALDSDEESEWEYESFPEATEAIDDEADQVSYLPDRVDELLVSTEDQVSKDEGAAFEEDAIAPSRVAFRHEDEEIAA